MSSALLGVTPNGKVHFVKRQDSSFDVYTNNPAPIVQQWMRDKFQRMMVYSPYFDSKLSWYNPALAYFDSYAIYTGSSQVATHPEWILREMNGKALYIPYDCSGGTCPQYAADITNASFRRWWIDNAKSLIAKNYAGLWIDDVNTNFSVSDGNGNAVAPRDPNTGTAMTWDAWRRYVAAFMQQIRSELPGVEILHNSVWYAGPAGIRDNDASIKAQIGAADYINIERGINDSGLTGGNGDWSLAALFSFVDRVHDLGKAVVIDDFATDRIGREYALAGYFLVANGDDRIGNQSMTPDNWWSGYDVDLGLPLGSRYAWNGLIRRDFTGGIALLNEPQSNSRTVVLPAGNFKTIDGTAATTATLTERQGLVLLGTQSLTMSGLSVSNLTNSTAVLSWNTNRPASTKVEYGPTASYGLVTSLSTLSNSHAANLTNLSPGVTYHARVSSQDASAVLAVSDDVSFTTSAPVVTALLTITSTSPAPNSSAIPITSPVTVIFSVPVSAATLANNVILTKTSANATIASSLRYDPATKSVALTPLTSLDASSVYRVTVKGGAQGVRTDGGSTMPADTAWTFQTDTIKSYYLSDLPEVSAVNGWGLFEKDMSNGELNAGDGAPLNLNGQIYRKGLGVHATSDVRYNVAGSCSSFVAIVGIDNEVPSGKGSVFFQVWADGVKLFESLRLTRSGATQLVNVPLFGRKQLQLVVTDAGDGNGWDHADWADAKINCSVRPPSNYDVSALTPSLASNGWGPYERDRSNGEQGANDGRPISIKGISYSKGFGVHASSELRFTLGQSCMGFKAAVGVDDEVLTGQASVVFQVFSDGVKLYDSGVMSRGMAAKQVDIVLPGTNELSLIVTDAGNGNGWDHADWGGTVVSCSSAPPSLNP